MNTSPSPHAGDYLCCPSCGEPIAAQDSYCESCGARLAPLVVSDRVPRDHVELDLGRAVGITDRGRRHPRNEDALALATAETPGGPVVIAVVCDGVSTADRPDEASLAAAQAAADELLAAARAGTSLPEASARAAGLARDAVAALARPGMEAPAATYVSAVLAGDTVTLCWLGDSRAYWLCAGAAPTGPSGPSGPSGRQLTRDDSLAEELVAQGLLSESEALASPQAHVVTRWVGAGSSELVPHITEFSPPGQGTLLLCSDGLWNYAPDAAELAALAMPGALTDPLGTAAALVRFAVDAGGMDNITVVLVPYPPVKPVQPVKPIPPVQPVQPARQS
ncbi:MAG TPA: PP2C family serine/threonine-protein phosphatase [Streptosporangiaceae bacterium]|nr:PP2C family serine/threonine-protein phosphatase [Streptosporangiaceae bacterium]